LSQHAFDQLLQKYLSGQCSEEEEKVVEEWYRAMVENTTLPLSEKDKLQIEQRLWHSIKQNIPETEQAAPVAARTVTLRQKNLLRVLAAACLVLLAGWGVYWFSHRQQAPLAWVEPDRSVYEMFTNTTTTDRPLQLEDSTVITLRPGATVYYPRQFDKHNRRVILKGSAFFNVHHDPFRRFHVQVNNTLMTEVLGTSFNIIQRSTSDKLIEIQLVTGKIRVYRPEREAAAVTGSVILTPNKKVVFNASNNQLITSLIDNPKPIPKTTASGNSDSRLLFEDAPLSTVLQVLGQSYGISIEPENDTIGRCHFTGSLSSGNLYDQLDALCRVTQTTYEVNGTQILIKKDNNQ
jgi:ferric-dicitrate binding protein FerR (iron transport regulator)